MLRDTGLAEFHINVSVLFPLLAEILYVELYIDREATPTFDFFVNFVDWGRLYI